MTESDLRQVRAARNQALFRGVNQRILELNESFGDGLDDAVFVCECARIDCVEQIELSLADYERVRNDPRRFFIAPSMDHYLPSVERLIEQNDAYFVVEKVGIAAQVAASEAA